MKYVILLMLLISNVNAEDVALGVSSVLVLDRPMELSKKVAGFITAENVDVVIHFASDEIVSVHKFKNDKTPQSVIVISVPLAMGRQDSFILIPEAIMPYDKVLEFVDMVRHIPPVVKH